jgi:radical SAM-linked protein
MQANYVQRLRFTFSKDGPARFIGHLDLARTLERSLNRAAIPLAYTQGYNRQPRMQFAAALPLGFTSSCELADIWLLEQIDPAEVQHRMAAKIAPGLAVHRVEDIALSEPPLQMLICEAVYQVAFLDPVDEQSLRKYVATFMAQSSIMRERRGKAYDLRPLILDLAVQPDGEWKLEMHLSLLPGKTGRPDEVLEALGIDPLSSRIQRVALILADEPVAQP